MRVIVHGGAGCEPDEPEPRRAVLDEAARAGIEAGTPVDAVERTVNVLEDSPRFNAGVGGAVQSDGVVRTDAGIMTDDLAAGAACSMPGVSRAVSVARLVMEETPHVALSSEHAVAFAADYGIDTDVDCWTGKSRDRWGALSPPEGGPREQLEWVCDRFGGTDDPGERHPDHDTVGAVATDGDGIAAATSTGGRWFALAGRVGDVPQIGSGFYCSPAGGASATGAGEDIARATLSRRAVDHLDGGATPQEAADRAISTFETLVDSSAGIVVCDASGETGSAYNSPDMQTTTLAAD